MAVYYKFKSEKYYSSIPVDELFISVGALKDQIFELKHLGSGTDFDLEVTNVQTKEEHIDEAALIVRNSRVLIRRRSSPSGRMTIVVAPKPKAEDMVEKPENTSSAAADSSVIENPEDLEWGDFGGGVYEIPQILPVQSSHPIPQVTPINKADDDIKIKHLVDTPALDWQNEGAYGFGPGRGSCKGVGGRMGGRGFALERKIPPQGYTCHRCKMPGNFIQHCPTNGDPSYDIKKVRPPTGIPKSMQMETSYGFYALQVVQYLTSRSNCFSKSK